MKFGEAFKLPFTNIPVLIIGIVLLLVAMLAGIIPFVGWIISILIYLAVGGFYMGVANHAVSGKFKLAQWKQWGDLMKKGLMGFVISLIYSIPLLIYTVIVVSFLGATMLSGFVASGTDPTMALSGFATAVAAIIPFLIIGIIIWLITVYIMPSAIFSYAKKFKFGDAFNGKVFKKVWNGQYFASWLAGGLVYYIVMVIVMMIPFVNIVLLPIWMFAGMIFLISLLGHTYSKIK